MPYVDTVVRLTATISYAEEEAVTYYDITAKRYYSDLTDGVTIGYMYTYNSTASDNTYENLDIIVYAFANANAAGEIENLSTLNSYLPSRVARAHSYGTYAILSLGMLDADHLGYMSTIVASDELRATLISNIVNTINSLNLDGTQVPFRQLERQAGSFPSKLAR